MRLFKITLLLAIFLPCSAEIKLYQQEQFAGKITQINDEKIPVQNCVDCMNAYTDLYGDIVKRNGSSKYNTTPLTGSLKIKKLYNYVNPSVNQLIVNSSNTVYYIDNSGQHVIVSTLSINAIDSYAVAKNVLWRDNGVDGLGGSWNGASYTELNTTNSTSAVSGIYIIYWNNRMWKVAANSSIVYYSQINDPGWYNQAFWYVNVNYNDGDIVTGFLIWNDRLIVTKKYAVYEIYEAQPGVFNVRRLYNGIGCLYNQTMDILPTGYPVWLSHRGIEEFTGNSFNLLSAPIEEYVKSMPQLKDTTITIAQQQNEFGGGTLVNIDTVTVNGFTVLASSEINQQQTISALNKRQSGDWQEFVSSYSGYLDSIDIIYNVSFDAGGNVYVAITSGDIVNVSTVAVFVPSASTGRYVNFDFNSFSLFLSSGLTYRFLISGADNSYGSSSSDNYPRAVSSISATRDFCFHVRMKRQSVFTSSVIDFNSTVGVWSSWGSFNATADGTNGIAYFIRSSTATTNITSLPWTPVNASSVITSTNGPYIQYQTSFTASGITVSKVTIDATGTTLSPCGKTYNRRYWIAFSTDTSTGRNNMALVYQRTGDWTQFNNLNIADMAVMKNELYYGDSTNTGYVYKTDVSGIYQDSGINYPFFWKSKKYDLGLHLAEKDFRTLWMFGNPYSGNMKLRWYLDDGARYGDFNFPVTNDDAVQACQFPAWTKARHIQFMVYSNDDKPATFKRYEMTYKFWQPREQ